MPVSPVPFLSMPRAHVELPDPLRTPHQVDCRRIVACTSFRRLEHKTQVFAPEKHDHFRTRLTHTLEVAQIARMLAHNLSARADLAEAIALAHDLGHPPFGHVGEIALNQLMSKHGGFNHNAHSLRVVEHLEHPFPAFHGLNLTLDTLNGLRAHESRYDVPSADRDATPSIEAQIVSVADRIAYNCHDLEDALGAEMILSNQLEALKLWKDNFEEVVGSVPVKHLGVVRRAVLDKMVDKIVDDLIEATPVKNAANAANAPSCTLKFSNDMEVQLREVELFLLQAVYRQPDIVQADAQGQKIIGELFAAFVKTPTAMPQRFALRIASEGVERTVCDYIAGMTDRFCEKEHARIVHNRQSSITNPQ